MFSSPESPALSSSTKTARRSTYQEAEALPWVNGFFRVAPKWITDRFNDHWSNGSQTGQAFCSVAGLLCHGPITHIRNILIAGEGVHYLGITRPDDPADPFYWYVPFTFGGNDAQLGVTNRGRIYWGREDQPADAWLQAVTGQAHPPHRGQPFVVFERLHCGQIQANSKARPPLPAVEFTGFRLPSPSLPAGLQLPATFAGEQFRGVNIVSALYDFLTHPRGGVGLVDVLDTADWIAKAQALENGTKPAGGAYGADLYISPIHTGDEEVEKIVNDYLSYLDGFIYRHNGKLRIDWFANDGQVPAELPEITHHDLVKVIELETSTLAEAPTQIVVSCLDALPGDNTELTDAAETARVPFVRELRGGESNVEKLERKWFTDRAVARAYAQRVAITRTVPAQGGKFIALPARAVRLDGAPLRPGDLVRLNWASLSLLVVARITERMNNEGGVELTWERERGTTPLPYTAAVDPRSDYTLPTPTQPTADDWTVVPVPPGMGKVGAVVFARRPQNTLSGLNVHVDGDGDWASGATVLGAQGFAARVTLSGALAAAGASVTVASTDSDVSTVLSSGANATEQANDELILVAGSEWLSIGTVTDNGGGSYTLGLARGRFGSVAAAHAAGDFAWLIRRERLATWTHAMFAAGVATYFKIQTYNPLESSPLSEAKSSSFPLPTIAFGLTLTSGAATAYNQPDGTTVPRLKVEWTTPANTLMTADGRIRIQYKTTVAPVWSEWVTVTGDQASDYITDVLIGTGYMVRIRYEHTTGALTQWITSAAHTVAGDSAAPSVPVGLTATVGTGKAVSLDWDDVTSPNLGEYGIYRNTVNNPATATKIAEQRASRFVDTEVEIGTPYFYWVTSISRSEVASAKSAAVTATPGTIGASSVDGASPGVPAAPTLSSSGTYLAGDGTVLARLVINVPAFPSAAALMNVLYRRNGASGWIVADQRSTGGGTSSIDDLTPGVQYEVAVQAFTAFGIGSSITTATGSPFTAPNKSAGPANPTGISAHPPSSSYPVPPRYYTGVQAYGASVVFTPSADKDVAYYEFGISTSSGTPPSSGWQVVTSPWHYYNLTLLPQLLWVRTIDRTGNASAWTDTGYNMNAYIALSAGTISVQNANDVTVTGFKVGSGSSTTRKRAEYSATVVFNLAGGAPTEDINIDLTNRGFAVKPDLGIAQEISADLVCAYNHDAAGSTSTNAVVTIRTRDGGNIGPGLRRFSVQFIEYD